MNINLQKRKNNIIKNSGFTLVEIMVATSIFMVIMLIAMGALITSSDTAKKSQALRSAMDNVNFAMESMTRSLRMGSDYYCVDAGAIIPFGTTDNRDCPISGSGGGAILFTPPLHPTPRDTAYKLTPRLTGGYDVDGTFGLQSCSPDCVDLVSPNVDIQKLTFFVNGSSISDKIQPSVYIIMKGVITIKGVPNAFAIQTMTSQRSSE